MVSLEIETNKHKPTAPIQIRVIAPANSMIDLPEPLRQVGVSRLAALGFSVTFGQHVDKKNWHTGATVDERVADIHDAVNDPYVDIVMAVFGGYNSNQLLRRLDYDKIRASGKLFAGYSDIDALLLAISGQAGNTCLHGPGFATFCDPGLLPYTENGFLKAIEGKAFQYHPPMVYADDVWYLKPGFGPREVMPCGAWDVFRPGEARGPIIGGHLGTLMALAGTEYFPNLEGKILFIEDTTGNNPGCFHQQLTQIAMIDSFKYIIGLMVGKMKSGSALAKKEHLYFILEDIIGANTSLPVVTGVNCSHVDPMMTLPLGAECYLYAKESLYLEVIPGPNQIRKKI